MPLSRLTLPAFYVVAVNTAGAACTAFYLLHLTTAADVVLELTAVHTVRMRFM